MKIKTISKKDNHSILQQQLIGGLRRHPCIYRVIDESILPVKPNSCYENYFMRTIIAGSRDITDYATVLTAIENAKKQGIVISVVISGTAIGVDSLGERYAAEHNLPVEQFRPDWSLGKTAGFIRNQQMAEVAEACIAVTNGSNGTKDMINRALRKRLKLYVEDIRKTNVFE